MTLERKRNHYLGFVEGIMTFLIVMVHCRFPGKTGEILATFFFVGVPFFFSVSGYFYYHENSEISLSRTKRKILHLFPMLIYSELFYYLWYVCLQIRGNGFSFNAFTVVICNEATAYELSNLLSPKPLFNIVAWFVIQLVIIYLLFHMILSHKLKLVNVLAPIMLLSGAVISCISYRFHGFYPAYNITNFPLFMGFPYFWMGYHIRENASKIRNVKSTVALAVALCGVGMILVQRHFFSYIGSYIGHAFFVVALWIWILRKPSGGGNRVIMLFDVFAEKYSMYVYLFHVWVYNLMDNVLDTVIPSLAGLSIWGWVRPFAACISSVVFAVILQQITRCVSSFKTKFV